MRKEQDLGRSDLHKKADRKTHHHLAGGTVNVPGMDEESFAITIHLEEL